MLTRKDFVTVRITEFADDRVLLAHLIAFSCQIYHFAVAVLGYAWSVQIASHEIGIGHELSTDEAGAGQVNGCWGLDPLKRKADCGWVGPGGRTECRMGVCRFLGASHDGQTENQQQSCFLHVTSRVRAGNYPALCLR